jgi:sarcosine oxidase
MTGAERLRVRWHRANQWMPAQDGRFVLARRDRSRRFSACSGHGFRFGAVSGLDVAGAAIGTERV